MLHALIRLLRAKNALRICAYVLSGEKDAIVGMKLRDTSTT